MGLSSPVTCVGLKLTFLAWRLAITVDVWSATAVVATTSLRTSIYLYFGSIDYCQTFACPRLDKMPCPIALKCLPQKANISVARPVAQRNRI